MIELFQSKHSKRVALTLQYKGVHISNLNNHNKKHLIKDKGYNLNGSTKAVFTTLLHQLVLQLEIFGHKR